MSTHGDNRDGLSAGGRGDDAAPTAPGRRTESTHEGMTPSNLREQARQAYRDSVAAGAGLNGKALGARFGRSERWGRDRIAETRPTLRTTDQCNANGSGYAGCGCRR